MLAFLMVLSGIKYAYLGQYSLPHRNFSASQLRLCLSEFSPATYTNLWPSLKPETQTHIKT
jgi:hypothetical protein